LWLWVMFNINQGGEKPKDNVSTTGGCCLREANSK
jgi:hypothetical protein